MAPKWVIAADIPALDNRLVGEWGILSIPISNFR